MAIQKVYQNDIGTKIELDVDTSLDAATFATVKYSKPSGETGEWTAVIDTDDDVVYYVTESGDLDEVGGWWLQAYVVFPDWSGHGEKRRFFVYTPIEVT